MADVNVNFIHPTDGRVITVSLDDGITTQEAVDELISAEFIMPNPQGYNLAIAGGNILEARNSFQDSGVKSDTKIRIIPATDAGSK